MMFIVGDTHFNHDIKKIKTVRKTCKDDYPYEQNYLIVCGDFGLIWYGRENDEERWWKTWYNDQPFTTLFVPGNHENYNRLFSDEFPEVDMFDDKVKQISDKIFMLQRGHIYNIDGKSFFCMGGAESIDKEHRQINISWWPQELPTYKELELGLHNLQHYHGKVDYIISHTTSNKILESIEDMIKCEIKPDIEIGLRKYFDHIQETVEFKQWFFGHFHYDISVDDKYFCLYNYLIKTIERG